MNKHLKPDEHLNCMHSNRNLENLSSEKSTKIPFKNRSFNIDQNFTKSNTVQNESKRNNEK